MIVHLVDGTYGLFVTAQKGFARRDLFGLF
jgi:hypothetical protein